MEKDSAYRRLFSRLKTKCKERNLYLDIPYPIYKLLIKKACHYCGSPPTATNKEAMLKGFTFNGLDRIDSNRGYVVDNIYPCCWLCNRMKSAMDYKAFLEHIRKIKDNL